MTYKKILFFNSAILFLTILTVGSVILTATNSLARGRSGTGSIGRGSVSHAGMDLFVIDAVTDKIREPAESYHTKSAANGSVHNSGEVIYLTPQKKAAPALMTMSFRPGDGIPLPAKVKRDIEALRKKNLEVGLGDKQQEFNDFMENNWNKWEDNWHGYYGSITSTTYVGSTVDSLPEKHEVMKIRGITYYYADGVYYASFNKIYVVVPPPHDALIETIPPDLSTVTVNGTKYYNYGGVFYLKVDRGYQVIAPPPGGIVTKLPEKAYSTLINKDVYYVYGNAYYKRFFRGSSIIFKIVKAPTVKKNL